MRFRGGLYITVIPLVVNCFLEGAFTKDDNPFTSFTVTVTKSRLLCAGLNRLEVEDERALRERSSDPLGLESCAATARDTEKGLQIPKMPHPCSSASCEVNIFPSSGRAHGER
jgi:hypothetical protein